MKSRALSGGTTGSTASETPTHELSVIAAPMEPGSSQGRRVSWSMRPTPRKPSKPPWDLCHANPGRNARRARIWQMCSDLQDAIGFQADSVANQAQHIDALWESFCARHDDLEVALVDLCDQLLRSQRKWWTKVWQPLTSDPEEDSQAGNLRDAALFLLIWGELGNLRYCPELICYLWGAARAYCAGDTSSMVDVLEPAEKDAFMNDIVKPIFKVVLDETFEVTNGKLQFKHGSSPAPAGACNYDDWNELFWHVDRLKASIQLRSRDHGIVYLHGLSVDASGPNTARRIWPLLADVDWAASLKGKKTHYEVHSFLPLFVGWYRIFLVHSLVMGTSFLWYKGLFSEDRYVGLLGLIAPCWMTFHVAGFQCLTPGISCSSRFVDALNLVLLYWSPFLTYLLLTVYEGQWHFRLCHYLVSGASAILALMARSENAHRGQVHPTVLRRGFVGMSLFVIATGGMKVLLDFWLMKSCVKALHKFGETNLENHVSDPNLLLNLERIVIMLPMGLAFISSYPLLMAVTTTLVGGVRGIVSFGGLRLFFYRHGFRFREIPSRVAIRLLGTPEAEAGSGATTAGWSWWVQMTPQNLSSVVTIWNMMISHLRGSDLINNDEFTAMSCTSLQAVHDGDLPLLLSPSGNVIVGKAGLPIVPEARRRLKAFGRSLSMNASSSCCKVRAMPMLSVLIPHYAETICYKRSDLFSSRGSTELLRFLVQYFKQEFVNFAQRMITECSEVEDPERETHSMVGSYASRSRSRLKTTVSEKSGNYAFQEKALLRWASVRMQTLWRTVDGIYHAYYQALEVLLTREEVALSRDDVQLIIKDKFQLVVAMQQYGKFAHPSNPSYDQDAQGAVEAMLEDLGPCLSIAYIEEESEDEEPPEEVGSAHRPVRQRRYFSCLIDSSCPLTQEGGKRKPKFKIELPGFPILGHGKSDNQNCAIIFTRGEVLQMIDANQDAYFEASLFLPTALQEFVASQEQNERRIAILGFREHIFSSVGALGRTAASSEFAFGTIIQRTMDIPMQARLHYGHPDMLDKLQMLQQGGVSKGTRGLNLSEDVFAGMDLVLRGGWTSYRENFYVGKGRDMGFLSVLSFHAKVSMGNGEQAITRQFMRLGMLLPLPRLFGVFYMHVGFYLNHCFMNWGLKAFVYAVAWFNICAGALDPRDRNDAFSLIANFFGYWQCFFVITPMLPLLFEVYIEDGLFVALRSFLSSLATLSPFFYVFQSKLMAYYFESTVHFGGARYIATGRGLSTTREPFTKMYRTFATTHLKDAAEIFLATSVGLYHSATECGIFFDICVGMSIFSWSCAPFIFNPRQFDSLPKTFQDFCDYMKWQCKSGDTEETSWAVWAVGVMKSRRSAHGWRIFKPTRRAFAAGTSLGLLYVTGNMWQSFDNLAKEVLFMAPLLGHGVLCFLLAILVVNCKIRPLPYAILSLTGLLLAALEMYAYLGENGIWWCILLHKYMMGRWMMQVADGFRAYEVGGRRFAVLHTACEMWTLSWRFARDIFIGFVLSLFCILLASIPGMSTLHTVFLFRTLRPKKEKDRPVSRGWIRPLSTDEPLTGSQGEAGSDVLRDFFDTFAPEVRDMFSFTL